MGNSNTNQSIPPLRALDRPAAGGIVLAAGPSGRSLGCAATVEIPFTGHPRATIQGGEKISIPRGNSTQVRSDGEGIIGTVDPKFARYLKGCGESGFKFSGSIVSFDETEGTGLLRVRGMRAAD